VRAALLLAGACFAVFAPTLDHWFVSDDFLNIERNVLRTLADVFACFSTEGVDFYRPVPRLHFGVLQGLAGDRAWAWNVVGVLLHALVSITVWRLAASLLGDERRAAFLAGLFFAVHFIHVEAVVWASSVTSLWAALFTLLALLLFRRARERGSTRDRTLSVAALAAALMSKEDAVAFAPLLLLTTAWRPPRSPAGPTPRRPTLEEGLPYAVLLGAWAAVALTIDRGGDLSPYRPTLGANVFVNAAFFLLAGFAPVRYWRLRDLAEGGGAEGISAVLREASLGLPLLACGVAILFAALRGSASVRLGLAWVLAAAAPFLLLPGSGERFAYLPSLGSCLVLGIAADRLVAGARTPGGRNAARAAAIAIPVALILGHLDRQADWRTASHWTRGIVGRWTFLRNLDPAEPVEFAGIPGEYRSAWVFRNGFDSMVRLYWEGRPYFRAGEAAPAGPLPYRMAVVLHPSGAVGMRPAKLEGSP
jgi:hypothetical protein